MMPTVKMNRLLDQIRLEYKRYVERAAMLSTAATDDQALDIVSPSRLSYNRAQVAARMLACYDAAKIRSHRDLAGFERAMLTMLR